MRSSTTASLGECRYRDDKGITELLQEACHGTTIPIFVGIDWGTQAHRVAVLSEDGRVIEQYDSAHSGEGLVALVNKLKQRTVCEPALVAIGIEVAWGALVETLVESGFTLFSINPKQVDRFRDRFTVAGAKDEVEFFVSVRL